MVARWRGPRVTRGNYRAPRGKTPRYGVFSFSLTSTTCDAILVCGYREFAERLRDQEVAGSNPVTPTLLRDEPSGQQVEGLSHCGDESCAVGAEVPTDYIAYVTLGWHPAGSALNSRETRRVVMVGRGLHGILWWPPRGASGPRIGRPFPEAVYDATRGLWITTLAG